jgi:hypothetical protein
MKRNIVEEISQKKIYDESILNLENSIHILESSFKNNNDLTKESYKYYPIALIGIIESSFRSMIAFLIDNNEEYLINSEKLLKNSKFEFEILRGLHRNKITLGMFVSHIISISSLEQINNHLTTLLNKRFFEDIEKYSSRWDVEVKGLEKKPIINNPEKIYEDIKRIFILRHIFAHEIRNDVFVEKEEIEDFFYSVKVFLETSISYCYDLIYPNAPLTQFDMNKESAEKLNSILEELENIETNYCNLLSDERKKEFKDLKVIWEAFVEKQAKFDANEYNGGSIMPLIYNTSYCKLVEERIKNLKKELQYISR